MAFEDWVGRILEENALEDILDWFGSSEESWAYVDRHVVHCADEIPPFEGLAAPEAGCLCAIRLFGAWQKAAKNIEPGGIAVSSPILFIESEWLKGEDRSPPPHVYVTIARDAESLNLPLFIDHGGDDTALFPFRDALRAHAEPGRTVKAIDEEGGFSWIVYGRDA